MMTANKTIPIDGSSFNGSLARGKTTWTRLAARHDKGGNYLDGHVGLSTFKVLQPPDANPSADVGNFAVPTNNLAYDLNNKAIGDPCQSPLFAR